MRKRPPRMNPALISLNEPLGLYGSASASVKAEPLDELDVYLDPRDGYEGGGAASASGADVSPLGEAGSAFPDFDAAHFLAMLGGGGEEQYHLQQQPRQQTGVRKQKTRSMGPPAGVGRRVGRGGGGGPMRAMKKESPPGGADEYAWQRSGGTSGCFLILLFMFFWLFLSGNRPYNSPNLYRAKHASTHMWNARKTGRFVGF